MVFVSKEPDLFEGKVKLSILIDGEELLSSYCLPQDADQIAINALGTIILGFTRYLLKKAPNTRHPDITQLRQSINRSKVPYEVIGTNLAVIEKHLPGGRLRTACRKKFRQLKELIEARKAIENEKTSV